MSSNPASVPLPHPRFQFTLAKALSVMFICALLMLGLYAYWEIKYNTFEPDLERMETADAQADVNAAIQANDYRFVGMLGDGQSVPGVDTEHALQKKYGVKIIKGTTDALMSGKHARLHEKAWAYALKYNARLLKFIEEIPPADGALPPELERMETADPVQDVTTAFAQKDYRLKGYALDTLVIPLSGSFSEAWPYGVYIIPGTSDALQGEHHAHLQEKAVEYVQKYNEVMLEKLNAANLYPWPSPK